MNDFKMGQSDLSGSNAFSIKERWFYLKPNQTNAYRVLPPMHSLADKGQFAKYHATHKIFIKDPNDPDAKAKLYSFKCLEKKDRKTGEIIHHCPFCEKYKANLAAYTKAKESGLDKDQVKALFMEKVLPYQVDKKFYINAVNDENKVSVLPLTVTAFRSLQDRIKDLYDNFNIDATGVNGVFLNFRKVQKYKGDRDTVYLVDKLEESVVINGQRLTKLKEHKINDDFIQYLKESSRDLNNIFKEISDEEANLLITNLNPPNLDLIKQIFVSNDTTMTSMTTSTATSMATSVVTPTETPTETSTETSTEPLTETPTEDIAAASNTATATNSTDLSKMSDEDFLNMFNPSKE